jgi:hypothetical protein
MELILVKSDIGRKEFTASPSNKQLQKKVDRIRNTPEE